ncbi:putative phage late control gene D [Phaeobacter inhibens]|nr:putative phage late control gene D [Phaeobacter inhibens]
MISPRQWIAVHASAAVLARFWYPALPAPAGQSMFSSAAFGGDLMAEAKVNLTGIKPELEGEWLITSVTHCLDTTLTTSFKAERDNEKGKT